MRFNFEDSSQKLDMPYPESENWLISKIPKIIKVIIKTSGKVNLGLLRSKLNKKQGILKICENFQNLSLFVANKKNYRT